MKSALKNLALVTTATLLCLFLAWFYLRNNALSEPIKAPLDHAFLNSTLSQIAYGGLISDGVDANSEAALSRAAQMGPQVILWVDVTPSKWSPENPTQRPELYLSKSKEPSTALTLEEALLKFPNNRFILNFYANREGALERALEVIDGTKAGDRVLIQSPEEGFLKDVREKKALWLYGSSQARVTQLKMLSSLLLEPLAPLKGDLLIIEFPKIGSKSIHSRVIAEAHRRKMKVLAGPVDSLETARALREKGVDGVFTSDTQTLVDQAAR